MAPLCGIREDCSVLSLSFLFFLLVVVDQSQQRRLILFGQRRRVALSVSPWL